MGGRVAKNRNGGTWSEARFWSQVRSSLRRGFMFWKPITDAKKAARRKYEGENKRRKWEYQCKECEGWFSDKEIAVDHIVPVGSLKSYEDIEGFLKRLTIEDGFQVMCKECHQGKTNRERGYK